MDCLKNKIKSIVEIIKKNKLLLIMVVFFDVLVNIFTLFNITNFFYFLACLGEYVALGLFVYKVLNNFVKFPQVLKIIIFVYVTYCIVTHFIR